MEVVSGEMNVTLRYVPKKAVEHAKGCYDDEEKIVKYKSSRDHCPVCGEDTKGPWPECTECHYFFCVRCSTWVPWSFGCDDDYPNWCNSCTVKQWDMNEQVERMKK